MSRQLTPKSNLDTLKKEAKRWLKALRANDLEARTRLQRAYPKAPAEPGLRDIQHALAQEHGLTNWAELKDKLSEYALANRSHAERVAEFMENAILTYGIPPGTADWDSGYQDDPARRLLAARILRQHPEVGCDSIHAAVLCGDLVTVERLLSERPAAASEKGGPDAGSRCSICATDASRLQRRAKTRSQSHQCCSTEEQIPMSISPMERITSRL